MAKNNIFIPSTVPRLSSTDLLTKIEPYHVDFEKYKVIVVGIRGYYKNTMGVVGQNDRGIYDDAMFVYSPQGMIAYNANTDPSTFRRGRGKGKEKGMASLKAGAYYSHILDLHKGKYLALVQRVGEVTVLRDSLDGEPYEDTGFFGVNIHEGGLFNTNSEACQTIPKPQYKGFITNVQDMAVRYYGELWNKTVIPYILLEN